MNKKRVFEILYNTLEKFLQSYGFKLIKSQQKFRRRFDSGFQQVTLTAIDYAPHFQVNCYIGIRSHDVEDIANPYTNIAPEGYKETLTLHTGIGNFKGDHLFYYENLYTEEDVIDVGLDIISFMRNRGINYFDTYSTIKAMDKAVNDNPYDPAELFIPNNWYRGPKGIVLAKLAGRSVEEFDKLANIYQLQLEQQTEDTNIKNVILPKYYKLVEHLRTLDTAELLEPKGKKSARTAKA